jgi:hypothetical protein
MNIVKRTIIVLLLRNSQFAKAQSSKIDSITSLINKAGSDTQRISLIITKADILTNFNLHSGILLAKQTL